MDDFRKRIKKEGVVFNTEPVAGVDHTLILRLKEAARASSRGTARFCLHREHAAKVHEMIIVHRRGNYVRPHRHRTDMESFLVIEGRMRVCLFDDQGALLRFIDMAPAQEGGTFLCRLDEGCWHAMILQTEEVVFLETTGGPFDPVSHNQYPEWAPRPEDKAAVKAYIEKLEGLQKP